MGSVAGLQGVSYRIREVDPFEDNHVLYELRTLHELTFFNEAVQPDYYVGHWWLVRDEETKLNVAFAGLTHSAFWLNTGYLKRVGVLREARGHGLQKRLLLVRERRARKNGWTCMTTDTTDNPPSANSLISGGYKIFEPSHRWAFPHSIYWKKDIS